MSQILSILLALLICLQMSACAKQSAPAARPTPDTTCTQTEPETAGDAAHETIALPEVESANALLTLFLDAGGDWKNLAGTYGDDAVMTLIGRGLAFAEDPELNIDGAAALLSCTAGLDGAWAESYEVLMEQLYQADPVRFLRAWWLCSTADKTRASELIGPITGVYDREQNLAWLNAQYDEISDAWASAEEAVRALPEADTVISFKYPDIALVDVTELSGTTFSVCGTEPHMVYAVTYPTTADGLLGPIVVYVDPAAGVLGFGLRE